MVMLFRLSAASYGGILPLTVGNISILMGPDALGAPDNLEQAIVRFIAKAEKRLDVAVQELESRPIADALLAAKARGVRVRVVLEGDYLVASRRRSNPFQPGGGNEKNRKIFAALLRARVDVKTNYNPAIFHQTFVVRDVNKGKPALLTGSTNFTPTGTHNNLNPCLSGLHPHPLGLEWAQTGYRGARHGCSRPRRSPIPAFATRVPATFPR